MDFIEIYDQALPSKYCDEIIEYIENKKEELIKGRVGSSQEINPKKKETWELPGVQFSNQTSIDKYVYECLVKCTYKYMEKYPVITGNISQWNVENKYNLQKYDPGKAYWAPHCEQSSLFSGRRLLVWMLYLNTISEGGGTRFNCYRKDIQAKQGRFVIWPAAWTHTHQGIVSNIQTKYIPTGWYSFEE